MACAPSAALLARVDDKRMLADMKYLEGLVERRSHAAQTKAADYLRKELKKLTGVTVKDHKYTMAGKGYVNLEVTIAGAAKADEYVFMGAHFDSNSDDATKAPGADDNASGTATVLEAARVLAGCRPARSVRLLFFSNEEKGTVGSRAYVKDLKTTLPASKLVGYLNVDMVAYGPDTEDLDLATKPKYASFVKGIGDAVEKWTKLKVKKVVNDHCG
jgi:leucyl aminopeptidase